MLVLRGVKRAVESLAFHPDGHHLVTAGGYSNAVEYWSVTKGTKIRECAGPYGARQVLFHPSGRWFVCSDATSIPRSDEDFITVDTKTWVSVPIKTPECPTQIALGLVGDRIVVHDSGYRARFVCREITASVIGRQIWAKSLSIRTHSQKWIVGEASSLERIAQYMAMLGFAPTHSVYDYYRASDNLAVLDCHEVNVMLGINGRMYAIDVIPVNADEALKKVLGVS